MVEPRDIAEIQMWPVPKDLLDSASIRARDVLSVRIQDAALPWVIHKFCRCDVEALVRTGLQMVRTGLQKAGHPEGVGVELGSGCGLLGSLVARAPGVRNVYAIDPSEGMHRHVARRIARHILGADEKKILSVVGTFDEMQLPDASVDFALNFHSLHHSDNLSRTLLEVARVLKPGGWILSFDRVQPDSMTDTEIEKSLSREYPEPYLERNGYPAGLILSRRENGEHHFRLREWRQAFSEAGLAIVDMRLPKVSIPWKTAAKGVLSMLPSQLTERLYRDRTANWRSTAGWFRQWVDRPAMRYVYFRPGERISTLMVVRKAGPR